MTDRYPDSIRYLGALDDEVIRARGSSPPDLDYINSILVQEVLFGAPLALNDGHLFHYEAGRQALTDREASPLLDLIEHRYVTILSRNGNLAEMPKSMGHIPSYRRLLDGPDWRVFHQRLRETQRILQDGFNMKAWPGVDLGSGFARLLGLAIREGGAVHTLVTNGVYAEQAYELLGRFEARMANSDHAAARSIWTDVCESAPDLTDRARSALHWLAVETYHHNFAMAMGPLFSFEQVGVVTRCSDIYTFVQEEPWEAAGEGAALDELPIPRLTKVPASILHDGRLLSAAIIPGSRLNKAKIDYVTAIAAALQNRAALPAAVESAEVYNRLLAEHFTASMKFRAEPLLQVVTAAFGAGAGAALGIVAGGQAALGATVGTIAAKGVIAGVVALFNRYCPVLVQKIKARRAYLPIQQQRGKKETEVAQTIAQGGAFSSVSIDPRHAAQHLSALPTWK